nr:EAL domain-containing protein [uncultured Desulfuromonas sp.]
MFCVTSLTKAYLVSFLLLAMWAFFAYLAMHNQIVSQKHYAELINISGKQRMLSQRTALVAELSLVSNSQKSFQELSLLKEQMERDHSFLVNNIPSDMLEDVYFSKPVQLDLAARNFFEVLDQFIDHEPGITAEDIVRHASSLLPTLDGAVKQYQKESEQKTASMMRVEGYILFGTLLTLILEAVFILKPTLRRANLNLYQMKEMVDSQTKQLRIYEKIFCHANDGIMITDPKNKIIEVNPAFSRITGYSDKEVLGRDPSVLKSAEQEPVFYEGFWDDLLNKGEWSGTFVNLRKNGEKYYQDSYAFLLRDEQGEIEHHIGVLNDITKLVEGKKRLEFMALHDALTGLPNRTYLKTQVEHAIEHSKRHGSMVALVMLDLDNFKMINDTFSHRIGDQLLKSVGNAFADVLRKTDVVSRIGGDEFILLVDDLKEEADLTAILKKIQSVLARPIHVEGKELHVNASMGIAVFPDDAADYDTLMKYADTAMYHAKNSGKNKFVFFTDELNKFVEEQLCIEQGLKKAIKNNELYLMLQPVVYLDSGKLKGFEALLRWENEALGLVPPDIFIPVAERCGQIHDIDKWVLIQAKKMIESGSVGNYSIAVNLSAKCFLQKGFHRQVARLFKRSAAQKQIILELTETAIMDNVEYTASALKLLRARGVRVAVDDFGTGFSSLYQLKHLPIDFIKIDKTFVQDMLNNEKDRVIVDSVLFMAERLNVEVVAEGIETLEQLEYLAKNSSCQFGQGYYFSKPQKMADILSKITEDGFIS